MSKYIVFDKYLVSDCEYEADYEVAKSVIEVLEDEVCELSKQEIVSLSRAGYVVVRLGP